MTAIATKPSATSLRIERRFAAPLATIWRAFTDPAVIPTWMTGPMNDPMPVCEFDPRPGGALRFVWRTEQGDMGLRGTIKEITPQARILHQEAFDDWPDQGYTVETRLTAEGAGGTVVTQTLTYASQAQRDAAANSGMTQGMEASFARLDAHFTGI